MLLHSKRRLAGHADTSGVGLVALSCRYFVDATGRQSLTARKQHVEQKHYDRLVGVGAMLNFDSDKSSSHDILVETVPEGWWYSAKIPDRRLVVVLFTDADLASKGK